MFITGIADEAGNAIEDQIAAHQELGWSQIELRKVSVGGHEAANLHDVSDEDFAEVEKQIKEAGMTVCCFSSMVANGKTKLHQPFEYTLEQVERAIPRMKCLGTRYIRIMSFGINWDKEDQEPQKRFRWLREIVKRFTDEGLLPLHENCGNYGGFGWPFTQELINEVPDMRLIFDTGNPVFSDDRSKPKPWPKQSSWEFYQHVRDHIEYVHIKDGVWDQVAEKTKFTFPGDGDGDVVRIIEDLAQSGYQGGYSIEPHMGSFQTETLSTRPDDHAYNTYVAYGKRLQALIDQAYAASPKA